MTVASTDRNHLGVALRTPTPRRSRRGLPAKRFPAHKQTIIDADGQRIPPAWRTGGKQGDRPRVARQWRSALGPRREAGPLDAAEMEACWA